MSNRAITRFSFFGAIIFHAVLLVAVAKPSLQKPIPSMPVTLTMHTVSKSSCEQATEETEADRPDTLQKKPTQQKQTAQKEKNTQDKPSTEPTPAPPSLLKPVEKQKKNTGASTSSAQAHQAAAASRPSPDLYLSKVRSRIEQKKFYPGFARRLNHEGMVYLHLVIAADGTIASLDIMRSSGHNTLDKAAMKAVRNAGPFPPLSEAEQQAVTIPLTYALY